MPDIKEARRHIKQPQLYLEAEDIPKSATEARLRMALEEIEQA